MSDAFSAGRSSVRCSTASETSGVGTRIAEPVSLPSSSGRARALRRDHEVVTSLHGHRLLGLSTTGIIELHERIAQLGHEELALEDTLSTLSAG